MYFPFLITAIVGRCEFIFFYQSEYFPRRCKFIDSEMEKFPVVIERLHVGFLYPEWRGGLQLRKSLLSNYPCRLQRQFLRTSRIFLRGFLNYLSLYVGFLVFVDL